MLNKDNNKGLFKGPNIETNKKAKSQNLIDHSDCILQLDKLYEKIKNQEKEFISYKNKKDNLRYDYNNLENKYIESCKKENILYEEIKILKNKVRGKKVDGNNYNYNNMDFGEDLETLYIKENIDTIYMKKKIKYYEYQINGINNLLKQNNINSLIEFEKYISSTTLNNNYSLLNKYDNIITNLNDSEIKIKFQKSKTIEMFNNFKCLNNRIKKIKNKISKLKPGSIIIIKGIKKTIKVKNEKTNDKIKRMEQEFNEYCLQQISWAKNIIGNNYSDDEIIKLLDIYNKLNKDIKRDSSDSECELDIIVNKFNMKSKKKEEYKFLSELGNSFINNNINDKSQIKKFIKNNKEIIYSYDTKDKINRFISTCKRIYLLSKIIEINNIINGKCLTNIRDMSNKDFDNLIQLLERNNKKE